MTGVAIISLDCEGKWGIADHLERGSADRLTDQTLREAYASIVRTLDDHGVPATFAFVELLLCSGPDQQLELTRMLAVDQPYLRQAVQALEAKDQGWSAPWALDLLAPRHEVACHGFSHTPWDQLTETQAARELELVPPSRRRTMVFPRNRVRHAHLVRRTGGLGYRAARAPSIRIRTLASEFNVFARSDGAFDPARPDVVPPGVFINWLSGGRRLVPPCVTRLRARRIIEHAGRTGGVAHFWTHPENIASHPATLNNLRAVVEEIARAAARGDINSMTQAEFLLASESGCPNA